MTPKPSKPRRKGHGLPFMRRVPKGVRVTSWTVDYSPPKPPEESCLDSDPGEGERVKRKADAEG